MNLTNISDLAAELKSSLSNLFHNTELDFDTYFHKQLLLSFKYKASYEDSEWGHNNVNYNSNRFNLTIEDVESTCSISRSMLEHTLSFKREISYLKHLHTHTFDVKRGTGLLELIFELPDRVTTALETRLIYALDELPLFHSYIIDDILPDLRYRSEETLKEYRRNLRRLEDLKCEEEEKILKDTRKQYDKGAIELEESYSATEKTCSITSNLLTSLMEGIDSQ